MPSGLGRSPGPDLLPVETLKLLPYYLKRSLLDYYNHCYLTSSAPSHWKLSKVVMLYKGNNKDSRSPSSYRPLSLANCIFKVYASMIQSRLAHYLDHRLQPQQFGFRAGRSISTPLFILRRLTELFERHSSSLYIFFLDWSQAFDSVSHPALRAALRRYGVPDLTVCDTKWPRNGLEAGNSAAVLVQAISVFDWCYCRGVPSHRLCPGCWRALEKHPSVWGLLLNHPCIWCQ